MIEGIAIGHRLPKLGDYARDSSNLYRVTAIFGDPIGDKQRVGVVQVDWSDLDEEPDFWIEIE